MKKAFLLLAVVLASLGLAQPRELRLFIWSEYIDPEIPKQFTAATGIPVRITLYESNEDMLARLQAGGGSQFDLIVPSDYIVPTLINLRLVQPLQLERIPNLSALEPRFRNPSFDPGNRYSVAYQFGFTGLAYRKDRIPTPPTSWGILFNNPTFAFTLLDSTREMMSITLRFQRQNMNTRDPQVIRRAGELLRQASRSRNFLAFDGGVPGLNKVLSGQASAAVVYNGDAVRVMRENPNIGFVLPREGATMAVDNLMIPAGAPNPEAAHRFINYILSARVGAQLSNWTGFGSPNRAARPFLRPEDLRNPAIYPDLSRLEFIQDVGPAQRIYDEVWTAVRAR